MRFTDITPDTLCVHCLDQHGNAERIPYSYMKTPGNITVNGAPLQVTKEMFEQATPAEQQQLLKSAY